MDNTVEDGVKSGGFLSQIMTLDFHLTSLKCGGLTLQSVSRALDQRAASQQTPQKLVRWTKDNGRNGEFWRQYLLIGLKFKVIQARTPCSTSALD